MVSWAKLLVSLLLIVVIVYITVISIPSLPIYTSDQPNSVPTRKFAIKNKTFIISMIIRERLECLPAISFNIEQMAKRVKKATVLVIENDSSQGVVNWFKDWQKRVTEDKSLNIVDVDVRSFQWNTYYKNLATLAKARNEGVKAAREEKYKGYDFYVVIDSDMCYRWDMDYMENLLDSLLISQGIAWDAIFANGAHNDHWDNGYGDHYDRFAYRDAKIVWDPKDGIFWRHDFGPDLHWWWDNCYMNPWNCSALPGKYDKWDCNMVNGQPLINVHSAFGGLGFYSTYLIYVDESCEYSAPYDDCEHVSFNMCLRDRYHAKLVVAPRMIIAWAGCEKVGQYHETAKKLMDQSIYYPLVLC